MHEWALDVLACPLSGTRLRLESRSRWPVTSGELVSETGTHYPVIRGVPRFTTGYRNAAERATVEAFGTQWNAFQRQGNYFGSRDLFLEFVPFFEPRDFEGRTIVDAGCGSGRWTHVIAGFNPKAVLALDYSEAVELCARDARGDPRIVAVQGSLLTPPIRPSSVDVVISIGVIHHLADPQSALKKLGDIVKMGGYLALWLYSYEGNEAYLRLAGRVRPITTRLPSPVLFAVAFVIAFVLSVYARTINAWIPQRPEGTPRLPLQTYIALLRKLDIVGIATVVYDQLAPAIAHYYTKTDVESLVSGSGLELVDLRRRTHNSWCVLARRPSIQ